MQICLSLFSSKSHWVEVSVLTPESIVESMQCVTCRTNVAPASYVLHLADDHTHIFHEVHLTNSSVGEFIGYLAPEGDNEAFIAMVCLELWSFRNSDHSHPGGWEESGGSSGPSQWW